MYPQVDQIVDALEDVGFDATAVYPYVIVTGSPFTPDEMAEALDIDPEFVTYSVSGDIRITCD